MGEKISETGSVTLVSARPERLYGIKSQVQIEWAKHWTSSIPAPPTTLTSVPNWLCSHLLHRGNRSGHSKTGFDLGADGCDAVWDTPHKNVDAQCSGGHSTDQNRKFQGPASPQPQGGKCLSNPIPGDSKNHMCKGSEIYIMCRYSNRYVYKGQHHPSHLNKIRG